VLAAYLRSLRALKAPAECELRFGFIDDGSHAAQLAEIEPAILLPAEQRPPDAAYGVSNETHIWTIPTFEHLARQKQRLLNYACEAGYTHVFFVDSDLLLEPTTLLSLWETKGDIVSAVFWTSWQAGSQPMPQCWLSHPYGMAGLGTEEHEFVSALAERQVLRVIGGGACVLIATEAAQRGVCYHPRIPGLPQDNMWQGEDRTFALHAARLHERQLADGWPDVYHAYHPEQRTQEALEDAWSVLNAPRQLRAKYGDHISLTLEPLEDPQLAQSISSKPELRCVRGRLGGLKLAPEIEAAVIDMSPGDSRIIDIKHPYWSPIPDYRGRSKLVQMKLVDIRPYGMPPVLAETAFAGVGYDS
jgi:hypothetical protein